MKKVEVFGGGCANCSNLEAQIQNKAKELNIEIELIHISDISEMIARGLMSTPAVIVEGKLVHRGGLASDKDIENWITS